MEFWTIVGCSAIVGAIPGSFVCVYYLGKRKGLLTAFNYYKDTLDDMQRLINNLTIVREHWDSQEESK